MARQVNKMPAKVLSSTTHEKYPWSEWFNGKVWELEIGVDFTTPIESFQVLCHNAGRRYGVTVQTRANRAEGLFYLQSNKKGKRL